MSTDFALVCVNRFIKALRFSMSTFALFLSSSCVSCFSKSTGFALVYVDRFKVFHFSMSIFALFPVYMSTSLCNYGVMFFFVVIFNPDVSMYISSVARHLKVRVQSKIEANVPTKYS